MNIAIIGSGFIGQKRAKCLGEHRLVAVSDVVEERARKLACDYQNLNGNNGKPAVDIVDWHEASQHPDVEIVLVSTTPDNLALVTRACVEAGKHVLVDKPAARNAGELDAVIAAAREHNKLVKVGFNHRYHPSIQKAKEIVDNGQVGPLLYIRGRYGHGGRIGYEKEWRADPKVGGGGELLDQGTHLIDLSRWFLGDFAHVDGYAHTYFWKMPVDDNAFMFLRTKSDQVAWLHVSWTEWKNLFCFEIFGRDGKLQIDGLGGSYGQEQLTFYKMKPEMGPPETTSWQFPGEDKSWQLEFEEFIKDIENRRTPSPGLDDAQAALKIVGEIYRRSPSIDL